MHFILLTDYYHPIVKSSSIIVGDLVDELVSQGHNITVITFDDNQRIRYRRSHEGRLQIIRIKSISRKYGRIGRLWAEVNYSRKIIKSCKYNVPNLSFTVYHFLLRIDFSTRTRNFK